MDTELFMECEEEELEPWQQVDDSVEEDDGDLMDYMQPVEDSPVSTPASESPPPPPAPVSAPAPTPAARKDHVQVQSRSAPVSAPSPVPSSSVAPPIISQAPPIILSQVHIVPTTGTRPQQLLFTTQGFPVINSGTPLLLNLQPGSTVLNSAQPLTLIQSPPMGQLVRPRVAVTPVRGPAHSTTPTPGIMHATVHTSTPERVMAPVGRAVTTSPALPSDSANGVPRPALVMTSELSGPSTYDPSRVVMSVEEFYYGSHEGDVQLRKASAPQAQGCTFPCHVCSHLASNNLRLMQHMLTHWTPIGRGDDRKSCKFCYRHFSSPFQLQTHLDQVHGPVLSTSLCRICEWAFDNEPTFLNHMKSNHKPGEMPYVCQVCSFRSSFYSDVIQHFATYHRETRFLLCVFCLKVSKNPGSYQQHLLRHQHEAFHCNRCRLQFIFLKDKIQHKQEHHRSFKRPARLEGLPPGSKVTIRTFGRRRPLISPAPCAPGPTHSNLIQPINIKTEPQRVSITSAAPPPLPPLPPLLPVKKPRIESSVIPSSWRCVECGDQVGALSSHYPTYVRCLLCPYGSCCSQAYASHMIHSHHFPRSKDSIPRLNRDSPPSRYCVVCSDCQFRPDSSDEMALHLAQNPTHDSATCISLVFSDPDLEFPLSVPLHSTSSSVFPRPDLSPSSSSSLVWSTPDCSSAVGFNQRSGPNHSLPRNGDAIDFFTLVFPNTLIELIVTETNAHVKTRCFLVQDPLLSDWMPLTPNELRGFLGLVILMGLQSLPELNQYWSYDHGDHGYTFKLVMPPRRFTQILQALRPGSIDPAPLQRSHGNDPSPTPVRGPAPLSRRGPVPLPDPLKMFRKLFQIQSKALWDAYRPNCCLALDRALLPGTDLDQTQDQTGSNARTSSTALPQVWLLCDSKSGYCHRLHIQTSPGPPLGPQSSVVSELLSGLQNHHHQLFMCNSVASVDLFTRLHQQGIYCSASFPRPHPTFPLQLWEDRPLERPGDFLQKQAGVVLATRWMDVKEQGCLSTNARAGHTDTVWRRSPSRAGSLDPMDRPEAFRLLQENIRGVDICKQLLACNPLGGVSSDKVWRNLFWFLVNISVVNAFILERESRRDNPPGWACKGLFTQTSFRRQLGLQLAKFFHNPHLVSEPPQSSSKPIQTSSKPPQTSSKPAQNSRDGPELQRHRMAKVSAHCKRCRNCLKKNLRHESVMGCIICRVNLCKDGPCFWEYHGLSQDIKVLPRLGFWMNKTTGAIQFDKPENQEDDITAPVEDFSDDDDDEENSVKNETPTSPTSDSLDQSTPSVLEDVLSDWQLRVVLFALCEGITEACRVFSTEPRLIRIWLNEASEKVSSEAEPSEGNAKMVAFVLSMREQEQKLTDTCLFNKASALKKKGLFTNSFRISYGWAVCFMLQNRLALQKRIRTSFSQFLPPLLKTRIKLHQTFTKNVIQSHSLTSDLVAAMDELCLFADLSLVENKSRLPDVLQLNGAVPLVTIFIAALADGTVLPSLVLANVEISEKSLPEFVFVEPDLENVEDALDLWGSRIWLQYIKSVSSQKSMLVLDTHHDHDTGLFTTSVSEHGTLPALIPPGLAFCLQPLEVCIKPVMQHFLLKRWHKFVEKGTFGLDEVSISKVLVQWTIEALTQINKLPDIVKKSFEVTGLFAETEEVENAQEIQINLMKTLSKALLGEDDDLNIDMEIEEEPHKTMKTEQNDVKVDKTTDNFEGEEMGRLKERVNVEEDKMVELENAQEGSEHENERLHANHEQTDKMVELGNAQEGREHENERLHASNEQTDKMAAPETDANNLKGEISDKSTNKDSHPDSKRLDTNDDQTDKMAAQERRSTKDGDKRADKLEDSEEEGRMEAEEETQRRETRIVIGADLGDEWQVTHTSQAENEKMDS